MQELTEQGTALPATAQSLAADTVGSMALQGSYIVLVCLDRGTLLVVKQLRLGLLVDTVKYA